MSDFTKPALTSTYTNFITELKARDNEVASLFSSGATFTGNYPARAITWDSANKKFIRRNATNDDWERIEGTSGTVNFLNLQTDQNITAMGSIVTQNNVTAGGQVQANNFNVTGTTIPANGIYLPEANQIRFTTNSTDRITILNNGFIGIGIDIIEVTRIASSCQKWVDHFEQRIYTQKERNYNLLCC